MSCIDRIPIVDISNLWNAKNQDESDKVVVSIAEACRDYGLFYIKNHGVDDKLQENIFKVWRQFVALPHSQKVKSMSEEGAGYRGYMFQGQSTGYLKDSEPDWRESYFTSAYDIPDDHACIKKMFPTVTHNNIWPEEPTDFKNTVQTYFDNLTELGFKIIGSLAVGLGLKKDFFDAMFTPYPTAQFGMFHYFPHSKNIGPIEFSLGDHTDYGVLTILLQDDIGGLEILNENNQWIEAPPIPGTLVINLGDMLEVLSNGAYRATRHRVRKSSNGKDRISMAFYFEPYLGSVIKPLTLDKTLIPFKDRKPNADFKIPVTYGEYLADKFKSTVSKQLEKS